MAIFFIGLSLNLIEKPDQDLGKSSSQEQQNQAATKNSWVKAIDGVLSPFAASLTAKELSISCPHTNQGFELNQKTSSCVITVFGFSGAFKKLSLKPNNRNVKLNITYKPVDKDKQDLSWPSKESDGDKINFVVLGNEDLEGKPVATATLECANCANQSNVKISFE